MNRKLSYNGKTIQEMTKKELQQQYETNKKRSVVRVFFLQQFRSRSEGTGKGGKNAVC